MKRAPNNETSLWWSCTGAAADVDSWVIFCLWHNQKRLEKLTESMEHAMLGFHENLASVRMQIASSLHY